MFENPPSGGSFGCGLRWLGRHSPLRGCSALAAAPLVILRQALKRQRVDSGLWPGSRKGNEFLNETVRGEVESAPEINFAGGTIDHVDLG